MSRSPELPIQSWHALSKRVGKLHSIPREGCIQVLYTAPVDRPIARPDPKAEA